MKKWLFIIFLMPINYLYAQQNGANYMYKSTNGYVHLYFDQQYFLVDDSCEFKVFTRVCKYNKNLGGFNGFFTDYYNSNVIALTGTYHQGKKDGDFKGFYPSGKRQFSISFKDNVPVGNWQYFYPSGEVWISLRFENNKPFIETYFDSRGRQKVKNGSGSYVFEDQALTYNEFGFKGIIYKGKLLNGVPDDIWYSYFSYPDQEEYFGAERFMNGKFMVSNYEYPENFPSTSSMLQLYPGLVADNANDLIYKACTVDDNQGYNTYLQSYLNKYISIVWEADELPLPEFSVEVKVNSNGRSTNVLLPDELSSGLGLEIKKVLQKINYWIPSFVDGKTINDTLIVKLNVVTDKEGVSSFGYPTIIRKNGR